MNARLFSKRSCFLLSSSIAALTLLNLRSSSRRFSDSSLLFSFSLRINTRYLLIWLSNFNFSSSCSSMFFNTVAFALSLDRKLKIVFSKSLSKLRLRSMMLRISSFASIKFALASFVSSCWLFNCASYNSFFSVKFFNRISSMSIKKSCSFFLRSWFTMFSSTLFAVVFVTLISLCTCRLYVSTYCNIEFNWFKSSCDWNTIFSCSFTLVVLSLYIFNSSVRRFSSCFTCSSNARHWLYFSLNAFSTLLNCCCKEYNAMPISSRWRFNFLESSLFSLYNKRTLSSSAFNWFSNDTWKRRKWGWSAGRCS